MTRILVVPEHLRSMSGQLQQAADDLRSIASRLNGAYSSLDWEARQRAGAEGQWNGARSRATVLAEQAEAMARCLQTKASAFESSDREGAAAVAGVTAVWAKWQGSYKTAQPYLRELSTSKWWATVEAMGWKQRVCTLQQLRSKIEAEGHLPGSSAVVRLGELERSLGELQRKRQELKTEANNLLNQILPSEWPPKADSDGVPWRVKSDEYEDQIAKLDHEIERLKALQQDYGQYYLLEDKIRQGIPSDGPSLGGMLSGLYGCTYYAATRRTVDWPLPVGNGGDWAAKTKAAGWEVGQAPISGALISFEPGAHYYDEAAKYLTPLNPTYGHVAYVEAVDWTATGEVRIEISEGNTLDGQEAAGPGRVRENVWVTVSRQEIESGKVAFLYGRPPK